MPPSILRSCMKLQITSLEISLKADEIHNGSIPSDFTNPWVVKMLQQFKMDRNIKRLPDLMTQEEIRILWQNIKEHNASSLSKRYNAVNKAMCLDNKLLPILTNSMNLPSLLGTPYNRWTKYLDI